MNQTPCPEGTELSRLHLQGRDDELPKWWTQDKTCFFEYGSKVVYHCRGEVTIVPWSSIDAITCSKPIPGLPLPIMDQQMGCRDEGTLLEFGASMYAWPLPVYDAGHTDIWRCCWESHPTICSDWAWFAKTPFAPTPEPGITLGLIAGGLLLAWLRRRR